VRNYYKLLGLQRFAKSSDIRNTIETMHPDELAEEEDMSSVLLNDKWCNHYRRTHLQYEAIAATINHPAMRNMEHTHNWDKRVVEFDPVQDTLELEQ